MVSVWFCLIFNFESNVTRITCFASGRSVPPTAALGDSLGFPTGAGPPGHLWRSGPAPLGDR